MSRGSAIALSAVAILGALLGVFGLTVANGPNMVGSPVIVVVRIVATILFAGGVSGVIGGGVLVLRSIASGFRVLTIAGVLLALGMIVMVLVLVIDSAA
ncbi:MAG: hypothetical protein J2P17_20355, partial [Mycobacterium sp.]|nr:hypothetical protein [Mycobacterium sp.]